VGHLLTDEFDRIAIRYCNVGNRSQIEWEIGVNKIQLVKESKA
jgi:hypothetical protein